MNKQAYEASVRMVLSKYGSAPNTRTKAPVSGAKPPENTREYVRVDTSRIEETVQNKADQAADKLEKATGGVVTVGKDTRSAIQNWANKLQDHSKNKNINEQVNKGISKAVDWVNKRRRIPTEVRQGYPKLP